MGSTGSPVQRSTILLSRPRKRKHVLLISKRKKTVKTGQQRNRKKTALRKPLQPKKRTAQRFTPRQAKANSMVRISLPGTRPILYEKEPSTFVPEDHEAMLFTTLVDDILDEKQQEKTAREKIAAALATLFNGVSLSGTADSADLMRMFADNVHPPSTAYKVMVDEALLLRRFSTIRTPGKQEIDTTELMKMFDPPLKMSRKGPGDQGKSTISVHARMRIFLQLLAAMKSLRHNIGREAMRLINSLQSRRTGNSKKGGEQIKPEWIEIKTAPRREIPPLKGELYKTAEENVNEAIRIVRKKEIPTAPLSNYHPRKPRVINRPAEGIKPISREELRKKFPGAFE